MNLTHEGILALIPSFVAKSELDLMMCIHPTKDGLSSTEVDRLAERLNRMLPAMNLMALGGHPDDPFNIDGLYTRQDPYPTSRYFAWTLENELTRASRVRLLRALDRKQFPGRQRYPRFRR